MSVTRTAADREEEAQLNDLRGQADQSAAEAAATLAELASRLAAAAHPADEIRRLTGEARAAALRAVREVPGKIGGQRGTRRLALAAIPVLVLAGALAYAAAHGKIKTENITFSLPQRIRANARPVHSPQFRHRR